MRGRLHAFCAFVLVLGAADAVARSSKVLRDDGIRITCDSADALDNWVRFVDVCLEETADLLGYAPERPRPISITFGVGEVREKGPFRLSFRPQESMLAVTDRLVRALILRALVSPEGDHAPVLESLPWVSAAATNRILYSNEEHLGPSRPDYQPARFLFSRGRYPEVLRLISAPVSLDDLVLYRLYAVHCDLLALCLHEAGGGGMIWRLLQYESHGRPAADALTFLLQDVFERGDNLQSWYERTVVKVSRRGRRISDAETIAQRLEALLTVPIVAPGRRDFRGQRIPIEDVPERLDVFKVDEEAMARLQTDLYEVLKDAPELLRPALAGYIRACGDLAAGKTKSARRRFRENRARFAQALERQRGIESYLDQLEQDYVPTERRLGIYLDVIRQRAETERQLDPRLHDYLDRIED